MTCPHCESTAITERLDRTELGYHRFRCRDCQRRFNERTGTPLRRLQHPTNVVCLLVLWRFRDKLSLRDLAEMFLAIDRDGHLIDARLSDTQDLTAAEAFFRSAWTVTGVDPRPHHHRQPRRLPARHTQCLRGPGDPPDEPLLEQSCRAGPSRDRTTLPVHQWA
jgi:hypothetical protein